jgi:hypothetical protein
MGQQEGLRTFNFLTRAFATEVFPDADAPAMPMTWSANHGGLYSGLSFIATPGVFVSTTFDGFVQERQLMRGSGCESTGLYFARKLFLKIGMCWEYFLQPTGWVGRIGRSCHTADPATVRGTTQDFHPGNLSNLKEGATGEKGEKGQLD